MEDKISSFLLYYLIFLDTGQGHFNNWHKLNNGCGYVDLKGIVSPGWICMPATGWLNWLRWGPETLDFIK
jgi:hypothetical protein